LINLPARLAHRGRDQLILHLPRDHDLSIRAARGGSVTGPIVDTMRRAAAIWTLPDRATRSALVVTRLSDRISGASR
jgi:hypothetical protein